MVDCGTYLSEIRRRCTARRRGAPWTHLLPSWSSRSRGGRAARSRRLSTVHEGAARRTCRVATGPPQPPRDCRATAWFTQPPDGTLASMAARAPSMRPAGPTLPSSRRSSCPTRRAPVRLAALTPRAPRRGKGWKWFRVCRIHGGHRPFCPALGHFGPSISIQRMGLTGGAGFSTHVLAHAGARRWVMGPGRVRPVIVCWSKPRPGQPTKSIKLN
jgi:hypothetical protein